MYEKEPERNLKKSVWGKKTEKVNKAGTSH